MNISSSPAPGGNQVYLSIVIPAYNEAARILKTLAAIKKYLAAQSYAYEVLVADDGSLDTTLTLVGSMAADWPQLRWLANPVNRGKGAVVKEGVMAAIGEYILFTDADNSTSIEQLAKLLVYTNEYPVVFGSRHHPDGKVRVLQARHRIILSRLSNLLIRWLLLPGVYDTQCGFKLFEKGPAQEIFRRATINRFGFDFEVLAIARHLGYPIKEVGIDWFNDGASKVRAGREALRTLRDLLKVKWNLLRGKYKQ